ncbi:MAG TPA: protein-L-isoaspartate(D-aspartate) O-methyltransferase [Lacipirellula sp.]
MQNRPKHTLRQQLTVLTLAFVAIVHAMPAAAAPDFAAQREAMVANEIAGAGVKNPRVLQSMRTTPRHEFVLPAYRQYAYFDAALPIGDRQTISPPYVVAYMTEQVDPQPTDRVLEIGTGSGYQAAVLSPLVKEVYTIEIVERLGRRAERTLDRLGYENVHVRIGDGYKGWPEQAPFDKIIVTCSPESVPQPLVDQLREGGQMIIPVGERYQQNLYRMTKRDGKLQREPLQATLFVPMTGAAESARQVKPDPLRPQVRNGGFEEVLDGKNAPLGWHYLRQARAEAIDAAPEGTRVIRFRNSEPGRMSQALQGFAVDGRRVSRMKISCQVRGEDIAAGPDRSQLPALMITFYDERRAVIDSEQLGPWTDSFPWRKEEAEVRVPLAAREAIVRIGLHGATGLLEIDGITVTAVPAQ